MDMQADLKVVYADEAGVAQLCQGFNRGFRDYKYGSIFDPPGMGQFIKRSGIELANCAVLLAHEDGQWQGAGAALLAVDGAEAWCGGLAVAPEYRRRGGAARMMAAIQDRAGMRGARLMHLEVLTGNKGARALYARLGYTEVRELLIWERSSRQGALPVPFERLQQTDPAQILDEMYDWHDLPPTWQRRAEFLRRSLARLSGGTIPARDGLPVAYVLYQHTSRERNGRETVHIFDVAVDPAADVVEAGLPLIQALQLKYVNADLVLVNEPANSKLNRIFAALGFYVADRQYELMLRLAD